MPTWRRRWRSIPHLQVLFDESPLSGEDGVLLCRDPNGILKDLFWLLLLLSLLFVVNDCFFGLHLMSSFWLFFLELWSFNCEFGLVKLLYFYFFIYRDKMLFNNPLRLMGNIKKNFLEIKCSASFNYCYTEFVRSKIAIYILKVWDV